MNGFVIDQGTKIVYDGEEKPVLNAINIIRRDIKKICRGQLSSALLSLKIDHTLCEEQYVIEVTNQNAVLKAADSLGFVYGLLFLSEKFLKVPPFWFWMEFELQQMDHATVPCGFYKSEKKAVRFRGWFYNDEVLMMGWPYNVPQKEGWKMAFEALLRCGGNMAIPGTDKLSRENRQLASDYGLWITHHHAEPLGAEMFARVYPKLEADYFKYPEQFHKLWEDAVIEQKDMKVVWNLCFRGQGDKPFWSDDTTGAYDSNEKRGKVISKLIAIQAELVKKYVKNPVFCTNLYGEIMELYEEGFVELPEDVILVRADNGYGKMVTRRRGNHNPRIDSMPKPLEKAMQGIYYHVSFYDLQAANQLSMQPNAVSLMIDELDKVSQNGGNDFWIINCSNVKPHVYFLDLVAKKWAGEAVTQEEHAKTFSEVYFQKNAVIAECYNQFSLITPQFGKYQDEHAGEQFYTENIRYFAHYTLLGKTDCIQELVWLTGKKDLQVQLELFKNICMEKLEAQKKFYDKIPAKAKLLKLQAFMHYYSNLGVQAFSDGYQYYRQHNYAQAFYHFGMCAEFFLQVDEKMKTDSTGIWQGFYDNDCQADFKFTAYMVRKLMGYVRELGDNSAHYGWQHEYVYMPEDRGVSLILLTGNHSTDEEIFQAMKKCINSK